MMTMVSKKEFTFNLTDLVAHNVEDYYLYLLLIIFAAIISVTPVLPGRKFVSILMRFWYLTSARLPDDTMEGTRIFQVAIGGEGEAETKRLLTANYESVSLSCV